MKSTSYPSQDELRSIFDYDPETGLFSWRINTRNGKAKIGGRAGFAHVSGYWHIKIDGRTFKAHRLAFVWMTGELPSEDVDHIDLDKGNNRWANLRAATRSENRANTRLSSSNTSGLKGVSWFKTCSKWRAQIKKRGRSTDLGLYDCPAAAHFAYIIASKEAFGNFARVA
jgi:hypothetical protein